MVFNAVFAFLAFIALVDMVFIAVFAFIVLVDLVFVAVFAWMAFIAFVAMVFVAMVFVASALSPRLPPEAMRIPIHLCLEPLHIDIVIRLHDVARGARLTARIVVSSLGDAS